MAIQTVYTVTQAAKRISLPEHVIRRELGQGAISGQKLGRDWMISADEVERLEKEFPLPAYLRSG